MLVNVPKLVTAYYAETPDPSVPEQRVAFGTSGHRGSAGAKSDARDDLKSLPLPELQAKLGSSPEGLSQAEAQKRLSQYGPNEIEEKKTDPFLRFLTYFWGPIPWGFDVFFTRITGPRARNSLRSDCRMAKE